MPKRVALNKILLICLQDVTEMFDISPSRLRLQKETDMKSNEPGTMQQKCPRIIEAERCHVANPQQIEKLALFI